MKVMIVVTHLLGTGHLARALTLARAYLKAGHPATVVSGGVPAPQLSAQDVAVLQLPPLRSDGVDFKTLLTADGDEAGEDYHSARRNALLTALGDIAPDLLITELFPFGRRMLRREFCALLDAAYARPVRPFICASIRDILAPPSKPEKAVKTQDMIDRYYDAVLVHADPALTPLHLSWPVTEALRARLHYTGFVAPPPAVPHPDAAGSGEILVTAGGGNVGEDIFRAACAAAAQSDHTWRLLVGGSDAKARVSALSQAAPRNLIVEPARRDFRQMLHHAAACVCMCGYNTALDLLQSGCRAVVIPFDAGNEVEQMIRARALAAQPAITVLRSDGLTPATLLGAVTEVLSAPARRPATDGFDGAAETVRITAQLQASPK
ncbi:glycosyltransferase family protein [Sulfitobacter aestuariivivens]|uniref:Glycosyltransferase n=1 Tax=Sulfitobacter aestuariivivens TaxID=2766981 RepID=A0A927HF48_9RHOB|nr:glycosyltransferase [Sulfitobacter aestuariivivens]MBD3664571.1 glycosyltransferase [Sulfitobacter aestuariivivens]